MSFFEKIARSVAGIFGNSENPQKPKTLADELVERYEARRSKRESS